MRGLRALCSAFALVAIGCQSPPPAMDPFLRTRVPPPATGDVGPLPAGAYGSAPAVVGAPGGAYTPPGGYGGQLTPVAPPPGSAPPAAAVPAAPYGAQPTPNYQQPTPTYQQPTPTYQAPAASVPAAPMSPPPASGQQYSPPGGGWAPTSSTNVPATTSMYSREAMQRELRPLGETARAGVLGNAATDAPQDEGITPGEQGLDPADKLTKTPMAAPLQGPRDTRAIEPVSYTVPEGAPARTTTGAYASLTPANNVTLSRVPAAAGSGPADRGATYGFDSSYAWLQGQLEYSAATKQWKVRYVPINGPTDRYGGSVVLSSTPALAGFKAGDFVSVKGRFAGTAPAPNSYAPLYQVSAVDRLTD